MARSKRKNKVANSLGVVLDVVAVVDTVFERLTGKSMASWLKEFQQQPRELPQGEQPTPQQPDMPLADAYAVLGLPQTASIEEVKRSYRQLALIFHPDKPSGYTPAMQKLNEAYQRILRGKKK